jgi:hypothetical protein
MRVGSRSTSAELQRTVERGGRGEVHPRIGDDPPNQGVAVAVQPGRGEADDPITSRHPPGQEIVALDGTDGKAREIEPARRIDPGHFRRLAADQGAIGERAALGDAGHQGRCRLHLELAGGQVIEKKQRLRPLHDEVVDAHRDQIDAQRVVPAQCLGEQELGADPVGGGDQERVGEVLGGRSKTAPKPPSPPIVPGRAVAIAKGPMRRTKALPAAISTPAFA